MVKRKRKDGAGEQPLSRSLRMYQRLAIGFVVLTALLLCAVLYLSVSRATIHITPNPKIVSTTREVRVTPTPVSEGEMTGAVVGQTFERSKMFTLSSEGATPKEAKAGGMVTIINKTGSAQPLVATTRLLSEEGVLFRIDSGVTVPANGQIETIAHADQPGLSGEIPPTQFTIPGLPTSLQDDIYAVSIDAMTGGVQYVRVLSDQDVLDARASLESEVLEEAKGTLSAGIDRTVFPGEAYLTNAESTSDVAIGTATGAFTLSLTLQITAVYYDPKLLVDAVMNDLEAEVPTGYALFGTHEESIQVVVSNADASRGTATLVASLDGVAVISPSADVLAKDRFVGRSGAEVATLLSLSDAVKSVTVTFTPFWLHRVPALPDHVNIDIEAPAENQ